ncbi:alpha/beta fold hydrolase [Teredinibacter turnerae]|uniref:alpha/beta fold hydrolase n=1 Tax=Teredinibacter turnerae TaxID=2426 RepID=UPI000361469C
MVTENEKAHHLVGGPFLFAAGGKSAIQRKKRPYITDWFIGLLFLFYIYYLFPMLLADMDQSDRHYLRQQLTPLQFARPQSFTQNGSELTEYFQRYGFDELAQRLDARYFVGPVELGAHICVAHCWLVGREPPATPRPTVLLAHGLFDHAGLFLKLVEALVKHGFNVFLPELPGHGLSDGDPVHITDFGEYGSVISSSLLLLNQNPLFGPVSLVGQSTGGAAILRFLLDQAYPVTVHKVVLLAPLVRASHWNMIRVGMATIGMILPRVPRRFNELNSHDTAFCDFLANDDPLQNRSLPITWVRAMINWVDWFKRQALLLKQGRQRLQKAPLLIIQGTDDKTVDWKYNIPQITQFFSDTSFTRVIDARHHLVNEDKLWREQVFTGLINFLKQPANRSS